MIYYLPKLDPVAFHLGPLEIRWYSLAYIAGILAGFFWLKYINKKEHLVSDEACENSLIWAVLSILLGGRLGYVLFYNPTYFLTHPLEILFIWQGGMSFHGGLIGSIVGVAIFSRKYRVDFLRLLDALVIMAPIGICFGRLANFMNMELWGRITNSNFGVVFPNAGELPRHPSQLYEAALEGLLLFLILLTCDQIFKLRKKPGVMSGLFLILYGSFRIIAENFREPDFNLGFFDLGSWSLTMGQILSVPLIIIGVTLILRSKVVPTMRGRRRSRRSLI